MALEVFLAGVAFVPCSFVLAGLLMVTVRAGPRVTTGLLALMNFGQVACAVFVPHWLPPERWLLPGSFDIVGAVFKSPSTLILLDQAGWEYERVFVLTMTQPLQMIATLGMIFVPCYCYKLAKKGEGSEWSLGNFYLYFQAFCTYLHVIYISVIETCLQPFTCMAHRGDSHVHASLLVACDAGDQPERQSVLYVLQAASLVVLIVFGIGTPAGSSLCFFVPSIRRRLQEHSRLPAAYKERQAGYYLVRDQHWARYTICRQFKPGAAKTPYGAQPRSCKCRECTPSALRKNKRGVSFERFWLSVETLWKLSVLILPLAVSDGDDSSAASWKFVPGAIVTFIMFAAQVMFAPYISTAQNRVVATVYAGLLMLYAGAIVLNAVELEDGQQETLRTIAGLTTGLVGVVCVANLVREVYIWRRWFREDVQAHRLEDMFKAELKAIYFKTSGSEAEPDEKVYDTEELVDLEMAKKLHAVFEMYKACYTMVAAELRSDMQGKYEGQPLPPEPYMETEAWRRVVAQPSVAKMFPASAANTALDASVAETLSVALGVLDTRRAELGSELEELRQAASASETAQQELHIIRREAEMLRVDKSLSLSFEDWRRNVDSWIDIDVAEWLANFVLAELKAETVGGKFKYPCLHSADHRHDALVDHKLKNYLKSKTTSYIIALQSGCRSKCTQN